MAVKEKKGKDDNSEKKRPADKGTSARPPLPKWKFQKRLKSTGNAVKLCVKFLNHDALAKIPILVNSIISFKSVCVNWAIFSREHVTSSQLNEMLSLYISARFCP